MTFKEKVKHAKSVIQSSLKNWTTPAIMCSFGKDSMVVLHLVLQEKKLPVIFHREPFQHHKYKFANKIIEDWDLEVHDYLPAYAEVQQQGGEFEIVKHYQIGDKTCMVPVGIRPMEKSGVCGLDKIYLSPKGTIQYPWNLVFHGHKSTDTDPIYGDIPLGSDTVCNLNHVSASFPVRHFTDEDIWRYHEENNIPIHSERYENVSGKWREREDKTHNPDYINACVACMTGEKFVECPKLGHTVASISSQLRWAKLADLHYISKSA